MADELAARESSSENIANDERVATMLHVHQIQQKQDAAQLMESQGVTNADVEFRRGLEELVRDHLNTCMALASCSSAHESGISSSSNSTVMSHSSSFNSLNDDNTDTHNSHHLLEHVNNQCHLCHFHNSILGEDHHTDAQTCETSDPGSCNDEYQSHNVQVEEEEEGDDQLMRHERVPRGERNGSLLDRSHTEVRPQARILSRWAAHRAQEMITMERQAREAELLALAGLHAVSMLDASFLREPSRTSEPSVARDSLRERPQRRASSLVQMWKELEEERRAERRVRTEFEAGMVSQISSGNFSQRTRVSGGHDQTHATVQEGLGITQQEGIQEPHNESEESDRTAVSLGAVMNENIREWETNERNPRRDVSSDAQELEGNVSQVVEGERDRVRQIVQQLTTENGSRASQSSVLHNDNRALWLGEDERERVRELAQEWVRVTNQQRADPWAGRGGSHVRHALQVGNVHRETRERESGLEGAPGTDQNQNVGERMSRDAQRLHDRQSILDLLMRIERERQRELQGLLEHRAVSDFAHRNRLQSLLRGRFLRNGSASEESSTAGELGQLRQRRAVSGLREGFRFRLETILQGQANNRSVEAQTRVQDNIQRIREANQQGAMVDGGITRASGNVSDRVGRDWQGITAVRRVSELQTLEEATSYNMELRELLGRRSVTTVLASEFRDRLDQLIRSFIQSQGRSPVAWDLTRSGRLNTVQQQQDQPMPLPVTLPLPLPQQQLGQQQAPNGNDRMPPNLPERPEERPLVAPPPPPPPPPQPFLQQELQQQGAWPRPALQRTSVMEWESIIELRADVGKLRQGMSDLQRMMETCMDMQLELQRSVRQELSGALQQLYGGKAVPDEAIDGSKWTTVKRGLCCVCCDRSIDSLLYRCGHMCTCLKCASELMQNSGKCPMCRAPIVEVVRAFTVA